MRVLILSNGADNGGVGIGLKRAFARHAPDFEVRSVTRANNYIGFKPDVLWPPGADDSFVRSLWNKADVVHIMDKFEAAEFFPGYERKPRIIHHHGAIFRSNPQGFVERARAEGIQAVVATFDLLRHAPELEWLPHPVNTDQMQRIRISEYVSNKRLKVIQSPGAGDNGTDRFLQAAFESEANFDVEILRRLPWDECMKRKARADLLFDSFDIGYGMTSVEAFAMGIPVISGGDELTLRQIEHHLGFVPFMQATHDSIGAVLDEAVRDWNVRTHYAALGEQVAWDFHAEAKVVQRLRSIYQRAMG